MKVKLNYPEGATPLDPNEIDSLIPSDVNTQSQLDMAEEQNILIANTWAFSKNHNDILTEAFLKKLHQKMFELVWEWAGQFRKSEKSIGVLWFQIPEEVKKLCDDVNFWIKNKTYDWTELGARFHHRLVLIHCFPNGNGRHARLITDLLLRTHDKTPFSWGSQMKKGDLASNTYARKEYINALRCADNKNLKPLIDFVRK